MKLKFTNLFGIFFLSLVILTGCRNEDNKIQPTCFDETRNQGELRVDCGGPNCPECAPSCDDRIANQSETSPVSEFNPNVIGIDCGGDNCEPCSTCDDGIQNAHWVRDFNLTMEDYGEIGTDSIAVSSSGKLYRLILEKGIDCGFPCLFVCAASAEDGIQNGDEEGVDCGGSSGFPCPPPSCSDGIQNGTETGIDCGDAPGDMSFCGPCPDYTCEDGMQNIHIEITEMVQSGYLVVNETGIDCDNNPLTTCPDCPIYSCFDGIQNGAETGIDCGGNCVTQCDVIVSCSNGVQDGDEDGVDCDFDDMTSCPPCATCADDIKNGPEFDVDCLDYPLPGFEACEICPSCHDGILTQEIYELGVDCGGPDCESCDQYLIAASMGNGSSFIDQYTFNRLLALGGNTDTLELDHTLYPGLKAKKFPPPVPGGLSYLRITANQGIQTASDGLLIKTVTIYAPIPQNAAVPGDTNQEFDMLKYIVPQLGPCGPILTDAVPYLTYREQLIDNPNLLDKCYTSYVDTSLTPDPPSKLTYDSVYGVEQASKVYATGDIDEGSLRSPLFTGGFVQGSFEDVTFAVQYNFF